MKYFSLLAIATTFLFFSCGESEEKLPDNVIKNSQGLDIDLEWETGGSSQKAIEDANLDLYLYQGENQIDPSVYYSSFETVSIQSHFKDGDYTIKVKLQNSVDRVDYTIFANGIDANESISYSSYFLSSDKGTIVDYLKIKKEGDTYTITNL
ncbi:hypothetical protein [Fulvivirga sediminis]|uniref:Uncharacterized protein n=1 Tax=Fulvivirga sediminis TaxID=2803949 RepID=A0A937F776_9BACT|nr:hypothetical protein [Fulvivirga sediminis]MBL3655590.1 hypothetical protein [Fulvivirga sediminis]